MDGQPNFYTILGIEPTATETEIHAAARRESEKFAPDARDPAQNIAYRQLAEAYETLSDPQQRAEYDAKLASEASRLLSVSLQASCRQIPSLSEEQLLYLLLDLRAPEEFEQRRVPINLCLVFDRSTSMRGERLDRVKRAARRVVESLTAQDILSIVTFSDRAEVLSPAEPVGSNWGHLTNIGRMQAGGGTEIYQGLRAGMRELEKVSQLRSINHLVLMTDGQTYGDEAQCLALARNAAARGVTFSAFGIGSDWNDEFLDQLVAPSGGLSAYIERPELIVSQLQKRVQGLGAIYAYNLRLRNSFPPRFQLNDAMKLTPFAQPLSLSQHEIQLGIVEASGPLIVLLELLVGPQRAGKEMSVPLTITADLPSDVVKDRETKAEITFEVVSDVPRLAPPPPVSRAVQMLTLYRLNEKVNADIKAGNIQGATKRMEHLTLRLTEAGQTKLAAQASQETQRMTQLGTISLEGRKQLKFGTRGLLTRTMKFGSHD
jgi:Ca-activated chloride channel family protein